MQQLSNRFILLLRSKAFTFYIFLILGIVCGIRLLGVFVDEQHDNTKRGQTAIVHKRDEIHLVTQWYLDEKKERNDELLFALCQNLRNPHTSRIHFFETLPIRNPFALLRPSCNITFAEFKKKTRFYPRSSSFNENSKGRVDARLTAGRAFDLAGKYLPGKTVILSNLDIYFDNSIQLLKTKDKWLSFTNMYFLSRYEKDESVSIGTQCGPRYIGSHDSFIFVPPLPRPLIQKAKGLPLGMPGIENRLIHDFRGFGVSILNPCLSIKSWHAHSSSIRNGILPSANTDGKSGLARPSKLLLRNPTLDELHQ